MCPMVQSVWQMETVRGRRERVGYVFLMQLDGPMAHPNVKPWGHLSIMDGINAIIHPVRIWLA